MYGDVNKMLAYIFILHFILLEFCISLPLSMATTWFFHLFDKDPASIEDAQQCLTASLHWLTPDNFPREQSPALPGEGCRFNLPLLLLSLAFDLWIGWKVVYGWNFEKYEKDRSWTAVNSDSYIPLWSKNCKTCIFPLVNKLIERDVSWSAMR